MVKIVEGNLLDIKAQVVVQLVNDDGDLKNNIPPEINNEYHHITREYVRFINHCRKKNTDTLGLTLLIPIDVWAVGLVDTLKNDHIEIYDKDYKYIACAFCRMREGKRYKIDYEALENSLRCICNKAQAVKANVAIPYSESVVNVIKKVFEKSTTDVYLVKEE